jgi:hypothetical protein
MAESESKQPIPDEPAIEDHISESFENDPSANIIGQTGDCFFLYFISNFGCTIS